MKQKGLAPILIVIIIALTLSVSVYLVYQNRLKATRPASSIAGPVGILMLDKIRQGQLTPVPHSTPLSSPNDMTNWKIYTNTDIGYSVKYMPDMELIEGADFGFRLQNPDLLLTSGTVALPKNRNILQYVTYGFCLDGQEPVRVEMMNDLTIYRSQRTFTADNVCLNAVIPLNRDNIFVDIQGKAYTDKGIALFNKILSTFKFLP